MKDEPRSPLPRPTDAELDILRVLWSHGPATVRQVHEALPTSTVYTSTLKIMQRMAAKGLVIRDETSKTHLYAAAAEAEATQRQLVRHLLDGAFSGSPGRLALHALSEERASEDALREIRKLLGQLESEGGRP